MDALHPPSRPMLGLIGCGRWGSNLARNFHLLGALAAVCDQNAEAAAATAARHGVRAVPFVDLLADDAITAVAIAAPAATHGLLAREALLAGKHVFVEKPLSLDVAEAKSLCALADRQKRILMVGHLLRYHPAFQALFRLVAEGRLGAIRYISSHRLNLGQVRVEENALWSFAPHDISMILALMGEMPTSVAAVGHCYLHKSISDVTTTHLSFASGTAAHVHVSWLHPVKEQRLVVIGERAMAVFDDSRDWAGKLEVFAHAISYRQGAPVVEKALPEQVPLTPAEPLTVECATFLRCVAENERPVTDGHEGVAVLRVLDAAQQAMEQRQTVTLEDNPPRHPGLHPTAVVDTPSSIGEGTRIWHFSHVLKNSRVGRSCNIGQNVVIGPDVTIGDRCKIQNNVSIYPGVTLEDGVFCGPSMVFTNVINPRAEIERKHEFRPTLVRKGASIGANATIVCGNSIGRYAMIGAGAVVTRDIPDFALAIGNPARVVGHVCSCGERLPDMPWQSTQCPACQTTYLRDGEKVVEA